MNSTAEDTKVAVEAGLPLKRHVCTGFEYVLHDFLKHASADLKF